MKPLSSATIGALNPDSAGGKPTGQRPGETGYAAPRPTSSDAAEASLPALRTEPSVPAPMTAFSRLSPLPASRLVVVGRTPRGTITAMALAKAEDLPALKCLISKIHEELTPVDPLTVSALLAELFIHYPAQQGVRMDIIARDFIEDLRGVSDKGFRAAVTAWRRSTQRWRPTPGQLLSIIAEIETPIRKKLTAALELEHVQNLDPAQLPAPVEK